MTWVTGELLKKALEQAEKNIETDTWPTGEEANVVVPGSKVQTDTEES